jgi:hypothetical protein
MAEYSSFFKSIGKDRIYSADQFAEYFRAFLTNGILNDGTNLQISCNETDLNARVALGKAWIEGYYYKNTAEKAIAITPDEVYDRIDRIVVRLDLNTAKRSIEAVSLEGTASPTPTAPALTRDLETELIYEISLAQIYVTAGTTTIELDDITDERLNESVCGLVNSLITLETAVLQEQWDTWFESKTDEPGGEFFDDWKAWFDSVTAGSPNYSKFVTDESTVANQIDLTVSGYTAYVDGNKFEVKIANTNTATTNININSLGNKELRIGQLALSSNVVKAGSIYSIIYNATLGYFELFNLGGGGGTGGVTEEVTKLSTATETEIIAVLEPTFADIAIDISQLINGEIEVYVDDIIYNTIDTTSSERILVLENVLTEDNITITTKDIFPTFSNTAKVDEKAIGATVGQPFGIQISPDGTKVYVGNLQTGVLTQWSMSTPFKPSTMTLEKSFSVTGTANTLRNFKISPDGTKIFVVIATGTLLKQYDFGTAWDIATLTDSGKSYNWSTEDTSVMCVEFNDVGSKMYLGGQGNDKIYQYSLSSNFDLGGVSYDSISLDVSGDELSITSMRFINNGKNLMFMGNTTKYINNYKFSTPYLFSSASFSSEVNTQAATMTPTETNPLGLEVIDGAIFYVGITVDTIFKFDINKQFEGNSYVTLKYGSNKTEETTKHTVADEVTKAISGITKLETIVSNELTGGEYCIEIDGFEKLSIYANETITDTVFSNYPVSEFKTKARNSTFDILNAVYDGKSLDVISVIAGTTSIIHCIRLSPDGLKLFVKGYSQSVNRTRIYQFSLPSAFADIDTATYDSIYYDYGIATNRAGEFEFSPDGTKLYTIGMGATTDTIHELSLTTAFDLTSVSLLNTFTVRFNGIQSLHFNNDGTEIDVITSNAAYKHILTTAYSFAEVINTNTAKAIKNTSLNKYIDATKQNRFFCPKATSGGIIAEYIMNEKNNIYTINSTTPDREIDVSGTVTTVGSTIFNDTGSKMYVANYIAGSCIIYQFSTTTTFGGHITVRNEY